MESLHSLTVSEASGPQISVVIIPRPIRSARSNAERSICFPPPQVSRGERFQADPLSMQSKVGVCRYARNTPRSCRCTRSTGHGGALSHVWSVRHLAARQTEKRDGQFCRRKERGQLAPVSNASAAPAIGCRGDWNWGCSPVRLHRIHCAQSITVEKSPLHSQPVGRCAWAEAPGS
jgi:hypothetical protein